MTFVREHILDGTAADVVERYVSLGDMAQVTDFGPLDSNIVVIDTETTGLSFSHDELTQIAAARMEKGKIVDWFVTFVNPGQFLTEEIMHLTGITEADLVGAPDPDQALEALVEFVGDATLVAHNAHFDRTFVTRHPAGYPLLQNTWIDSLDLSRIALPRLKSHRLIDLVRTFGAPVSTHRADDDVAATCVIYRILLAGVAAMPLALVRAISQLAPQEEWETSYVFKVIADMREGQGEQEVSATPATQQPESANQKTHKRAFSLFTLRQQRIKELPTRRVRKDADELVGELVFPTDQDIQQAFTKNGLLGRIYPGYEEREEQLAMALAVRNAFEKHESLVVEAGTGVGK